jgi:hypothetical protein
VGKVNNALVFEPGQAVVVPDHAALDFVADQDFSIDAWVKEDYDWADFDSPIVSKIGDFTPISPGYRFFMTAGPPERVALDLSNGTSHVRYTSVAGIPFGDQEWHHVAVTVDRDQADGIRFYYDGQLADSHDPTALNVDLSNALPLYIGSDPIGDAPPPGYRLDEIEIFRRVLTPEEVFALYQADYKGKCRPGLTFRDLGGSFVAPVPPYPPVLPQIRVQ